MHIWAYDFKSESARALADKLDVRIIRHENSTFKGAVDKVVLNWGSSDLPREVRFCNVINTERAVHMAVNKRHCLRVFDQAGVPTVKWTENKEWAKAWAYLGHKIVCRTKVEGKDGEGIILASKPEDIVDAKLYTKFEEGCDEYRVTVFRDEVVCVQKKVRIPGLPAYNDAIRTTAGGYGFEVLGAWKLPQAIIHACTEAVKAIGLDFGGVDILVGKENLHVLEVNTAPVLTPHCLEKFSTAIKKVYPNG